ncbi:LPXTG cell wall anchor domain-containing protein [Vallitalea guaymasensis]|uniref:LPXTG cell wall anchor domain-containing protein n=1 Tax=Vallitalea guaymasensis TaxID=1185412 RepID=A0A8J8MAJ8_9FIRM|nr:LPXTG cell wall anchor domain-containing protein [Vallitalea guaymasensis]QUH29150.1 LPXTG cell wall anchor domain-containing protein [Vallitalea guaymasensis]
MKKKLLKKSLVFLFAFMYLTSNLVYAQTEQQDLTGNIIISENETENPEEPVENPGEPVENPGEPVENPGEPVENPGEPVENPGEPVENPGEPVENPGEPVENPGEPVENPGEPVDNPEEPVENPGEPVDNPEEPVENPGEPVENPEEPAENPEDPGENPSESEDKLKESENLDEIESASRDMDMLSTIMLNENEYIISWIINKSATLAVNQVSGADVRVEKEQNYRYKLTATANDESHRIVGWKIIDTSNGSKSSFGKSEIRIGRRPTLINTDVDYKVNKNRRYEATPIVETIYSLNVNYDNSLGEVYIDGTKVDNGYSAIYEEGTAVNLKAYSYQGYEPQDQFKNMDITINQKEIIDVVFESKDQVYDKDYYPADGSFAGIVGHGHDPKDNPLDAELNISPNKDMYEVGDNVNLEFRYNVISGDNGGNSLNEVKVYRHNTNSPLFAENNFPSTVQDIITIPSTKTELDNNYVFDVSSRTYSKNLEFDLVDQYNDDPQTILDSNTQTIKVSVANVWLDAPVLNTTDVTMKSGKVYWEKLANANDYDIKVYDENGVLLNHSLAIEFDDVTNRYYVIDNSLTPGTKYIYKVTASNSFMTSEEAETELVTKEATIKVYLDNNLVNSTDGNYDFAKIITSIVDDRFNLSAYSYRGYEFDRIEGAAKNHFETGIADNVSSEIYFNSKEDIYGYKFYSLDGTAYGEEGELMDDVRTGTIELDNPSTDEIDYSHSHTITAKPGESININTRMTCIDGDNEEAKLYDLWVYVNGEKSDDIGHIDIPSDPGLSGVHTLTIPTWDKLTDLNNLTYKFDLIDMHKYTWAAGLTDSSSLEVEIDIPEYHKITVVKNNAVVGISGQKKVPQIIEDNYGTDLYLADNVPITFTSSPISSDYDNLVWTVNGLNEDNYSINGNVLTINTFNADVTVLASYSLKQFTTTVNYTEGGNAGVVSGDNLLAQLTSDIHSNITMKAVPEKDGTDDMYLVKWYRVVGENKEFVSNNKEITVSVTSNETYLAEFNIKQFNIEPNSKINSLLGELQVAVIPQELLTDEINNTISYMKKNKNNKITEELANRWQEYVNNLESNSQITFEKCVVGNDVKYDYGTIVAVKGVPHNTFDEFKKWNVLTNYPNPRLVYMNQNRRPLPLFEDIVSYILTVDVENNGHLNESELSIDSAVSGRYTGEFIEDYVTTFKIVPDKGYYPVAYLVNSLENTSSSMVEYPISEIDGDYYVNVEMNNNKSMIIEFRKREYNIKAVIMPGKEDWGSIKQNSESFKYVYGDSVVIKAEQSKDYIFDGWYIFSKENGYTRLSSELTYSCNMEFTAERNLNIFASFLYAPPYIPGNPEPQEPKKDPEPVKPQPIESEEPSPETQPIEQPATDEPFIEIPEEPIPEGNLTDTDTDTDNDKEEFIEGEEIIEILDGDVPLGTANKLPKTGGIPAQLFYLFGTTFIGAGIKVKKKKK